MLVLCRWVQLVDLLHPLYHLHHLFLVPFLLLQPCMCSTKNWMTFSSSSPAWFLLLLLLPSFGQVAHCNLSLPSTLVSPSSLLGFGCRWFPIFEDQEHPNLSIIAHSFIFFSFPLTAQSKWHHLLFHLLPVEENVKHYFYIIS